MLNFKKQNSLAGVTLIELMVALTIGALLLSIVIAMFLTNLSYYHKMLMKNRFEQQLYTVLDLITTDIRRAGYWSSVNNDIGTHQNNNPFMTSSTDITINGSQNCILMTYDHEKNGSLPSINANAEDDRYGYQLSGTTIQARPRGANFACGSANWETITDSKIIEITSLSFVLNTTTITTGPGSRGIAVRSVDITISGHLKNDSSVTKTVSQHVRIRNDKYIP